MAKRKPAAAADGAATAGDLQKSWPFPTTHPDDVADTSERDEATTADADAGTVTADPDRIQVSSIRLYTDPTQNQVMRIALEQLLESPFNPRTHYDEKALNELAETIRGVGVMEPILVRPVATPGVSITRGDEVFPSYEIVFGHRRSRAAKLAGEEAVPAIVRELTDAQAAQLQAIENVQRKDLDPLEEARGYAHYCKVHGVTKDQLAAEIGLSRTHVYSSLKLLDGVAQVQDALAAGKIGKEVAILVSRLPSPKLQEKAIKRIEAKYWDLEDGGKRSYRQIRELLREEFTLDLGGAIFNTADVELVPLAGACTTCPKRTGNAPEFADLADGYDTGWRAEPRKKGAPNICTDPECWDLKKKAHLKAAAAVLTAKGKTVVEGNKARAAISADGVVKGAYIALKDVKAELIKATKGRKTLAGNPVEVETVLIQNPRNGKTVEAVAVAALKEAGVKVKEKSSPGGHNHDDYYRRQREEQAKREAKGAVETKVNSAIFMSVREQLKGKPLTVVDLQAVARLAWAGVDWAERNLLAQLYEAKSEDALAKRIGQMSGEEVTLFVLDCALIDGVHQSGYHNGKPDTLLAAAKRIGVDIAMIRKEVTDRGDDVKTQDLFHGELAESSEAAGEEAEAA